MTSTKPCACKGKRTCLVCEPLKHIENTCLVNQKKSYIYCSECGSAWYDAGNSRKHPNHTGDNIDFPGVTLIKEFVSPEEEDWLVKNIDTTAWVDSQSGRRKQDYGPKVNFKKKKVKASAFTGLPDFSKMLVKRMNDNKLLEDFEPVELCNLEYTPERGSAIDPHFDDSWIWGERLVTLNLLSDTKHTMTSDSHADLEVLIPLPRRSLVIVQGPARHDWKHAIKRSDITARRLAMTFRELTPEFLQGGQNEALGQQLLKTAAMFNGVAVGTTCT